MTGHDEEVVDLRAFEAVGGQLRLVGNLRIVLVEVLGDVDNGLLDELEVTHTTDDDAQRDGVIGLRSGLIELGRDIELSHSTREVGRALRQGIDLDLDARCHNLLLDLDIARAAVEEGLKGIDIAVLLHDDTLEGDRGDMELSRHLREHDVLAPGTCAVRTSVDGLYREALLLREIHLLRVEALQVGHVATELGQRYEGVDLIGEQDRLLFVNALLVGTDLDEEVGT